MSRGLRFEFLEMRFLVCRLLKRCSGVSWLERPWKPLWRSRMGERNKGGGIDGGRRFLPWGFLAES